MKRLVSGVRNNRLATLHINTKTEQEALDAFYARLGTEGVTKVHVDPFPPQFESFFQEGFFYK